MDMYFYLLWKSNVTLVRVRTVIVFGWLLHEVPKKHGRNVKNWSYLVIIIWGQMVCMYYFFFKAELND